MDIEAGDWVLVDGKDVAKVHREDLFGDNNYAFITYWYGESKAIHNAYLNKKRLTKLDPALNVLFERKENG